jgi:hypothetical protein
VLFQLAKAIGMNGVENINRGTQVRFFQTLMLQFLFFNAVILGMNFFCPFIAGLSTPIIAMYGTFGHLAAQTKSDPQLLVEYHA